MPTLPRYTNSQIQQFIDDRIHSKRDRRILYLKLVDGATFLQIAEEMDMPVSTVTDAYYKNVKTLFADW